ncbi:alpha/beta fold hydrolase [Desulfurivibrio sp. D14AmB]|uniref:alpha/beta fold hydrolase n=1 Tax=Desulfurivibrio sp. D14AmB TaxID=3374370 RepID=UPI00376ECFBF
MSKLSAAGTVLCNLRGHDGVTLVGERRGEGEPLLLFVHGWTCRRSYWEPQLTCFGREQAVAAVDLPGHGDSGAGRRQVWGVQSLAADLEACVGELGARRVILVGHSMGGAVALEAARRLAGVAEGVVLVDTFIIDYGGLSPETVQAVFSPFAADFAAAIAALVEQTSTPATPPELKRKLSREMAQADPAWALPLWRDLLSWDPAAAFAELRIPIHAINGALIPESARHRCAPFVQETIIPGAGHFLQMEDPSGFNQILTQLLSRLAR